MYMQGGKCKPTNRLEWKFCRQNRVIRCGKGQIATGAGQAWSGEFRTGGGTLQKEVGLRCAFS